ncbi:gamma-interferon-inducible lysosomal thiol reductase-like [Amphibalanus amphitrite]|uniref:gamma-interferon-inducible lysosomal thiol reductase-like n=1 Tax=Amphibalanus amphitrite TaxID=1232801 RepID=UPI001C926582|nr:gamma-interferon-inducible lysosomal thiol reductase-like [Amphibalanus amphitrite]
MFIVVWSLLLTAVAAAAADPTPPLQVVLYYESLCPDCQAFVSGSFAEAWHAVPEILNVTLVPWGFATATPDGAGGWVFQCQHGPAECRGNKLHACGVYLAPSPAVSVDFSICLESQMAGEQCAQQTGLDWLSLTDCQLRRDTDQLMIPYRDMTDAARPEIVEVPTVSVDGRQEHQGQMLDDFLGYVCSVWQGDTPDGCPPAH